MAPVSLGTHLNLPYLVNELFATLRENGVIRKRRKPDYADFRGPRRTRLLPVRLRGGGEHGVVPLPVPVVALQRHRSQLPVGDPDAQRVAALVQLGLDP